MISVPVLPISDAKLCIRPRKALHLPTQSFASAHAKLCIRQRKALPSFRSSIAMFFQQSRYLRFCAYSATITYMK